MAMDPKKYIAVMSNWRDQFIASTKTTVFGMTDADLASIAVPTVVIPGNDQTHASANGRVAAERIPGAVLHQLPIQDQEVPLINYTEWAPLEPEIAQAFLDLMRKMDAQQSAPAPPLRKYTFGADHRGVNRHGVRTPIDEIERLISIRQAGSNLSVY